jgi:chromosome segregation ATPase
MLKRLEIAGFKSFARKTVLDFSAQATAIVGPNGSGKSNVAEAFRFALGEQSIKSMRGKRTEDLIFAGSNMSARANRAAVAIVFDNTSKKTGRLFPKLDFDELTIERAIFRDGSSEYSINGSKARLRDIQELLASANIGETGHHIISQGEADRILSSTPRERRSMLEDALGLKVFEFKKQDAERKLEKTEENVKQVEALRREITPHIRFLAKQVERLERADQLRSELQLAYQTYFAIEETYLKYEKEKVTEDKARAAERLASAEAELEVFEQRTTHDVEGLKRADAVRNAERTVDRVTTERAQLSREIGRVEGGLAAAKKRALQTSRDPDLYVKVSREDLEMFRKELEDQSAIDQSSPAEKLFAALSGIRKLVSVFFERFAAPVDDLMAEDEGAVMGYENDLVSMNERDREFAAQLEEARAALLRAREAVFAYEETGREERHRVLQLAETKAQEESSVVRLDARLSSLEMQTESFNRERGEAMAITGTPSLSYVAVEELPNEDRRVQEDRLRTIERLKIRVEEAGGAGEDVRIEYKDAVERESFLARELEDLAHSANGLRLLIKDLDEELSKTFADGLQKVNQSFTEFFALMFNGGSARLVLEEISSRVSDEDDESEDYEVPLTQTAKGKAGIEISVNLPKKRVQALMQLSGGERALTSIALIFAMSQVNPPPFLILDETDAALDEANSRRYGDMIENLAKKSQLIVISHNRETMSRAGLLYGVTMGADGISKLLSVKFEEAAAVAK